MGRSAVRFLVKVKVLDQVRVVRSISDISKYRYSLDMIQIDRD